MAASDYTYITYNLRTGARLAELPLSGVTYSDKLNRSDTMTGRVALNSADVRSIDVVSATERARTGLYIDKAGVPVWDGIVWDRSYDSATTELTLDCATTWSYFSRRRNGFTSTWNGADQGQIFWSLLANNIGYGTSNSVLDIGLVLAPLVVTGRLRDRQYVWNEKQTISELIENLAAVQDGFDFSIDLSYSGGSLVRTIRMYYPRRGRSSTASGHVLEYGAATRGNIVKYTWPDPGSQEANQIWNLGAGNGDTMLISSQVRSDRHAAGWPLLEDVISNKSTTQYTTLISQALAEVNARADIQGVPTVTILADGDPALGAWTLGDDVRLRIDDYRFPRASDGTFALDTWRRIVGYGVHVPDDGSAELVDLTLSLAL